MRLSTLVPLLAVPLVAAQGVHKLTLKKVPPAINNPALETAYLAEKYGGQVPMLGAGGVGRNLRDSRPSEDDLFWTQETLSGGHNVPLSSKQSPHLLSPLVNEVPTPRLHECAVLCRNFIGNTTANCMLLFPDVIGVLLIC